MGPASIETHTQRRVEKSLWCSMGHPIWPHMQGDAALFCQWETVRSVWWVDVTVTVGGSVCVWRLVTQNVVVARYFFDSGIVTLVSWYACIVRNPCVRTLATVVPCLTEIYLNELHNDSYIFSVPMYTRVSRIRSFYTRARQWGFSYVRCVFTSCATAIHPYTRHHFN